MLTKRDQFVRWLDPLQMFWEDAEGSVHLSITDALKAFELEDIPENRNKVMEIVKSLLPEQQFTVREKPDSEEYYTQPVHRQRDNPRNQ